MVFTLEALRAGQGDALLLHYGDGGDPRLCIIDGGPGGAFGDAVQPRLTAIRDRFVADGRLADGDPLRADLIMVSHLDDDHIGGVLALTDSLLADPNRAPWLTTKAVWNNTFADLADDKDGILEQAKAPNPDAAHVVSVTQGRKLRTAVDLLAWPVNVPFDDLVQAPDQGGRRVTLDAETDLLVISPRAEQIAKLRKKWAQEVKRLEKQETSVAQLVEYLDTSPFNLSSIVCLARQAGRTMLLTGDARGDHVLEGLEAAGVMTDGALHVDILKMPHHGSLRNVDDDFFERITADHYVISGNGSDGNPETQTLEMITGSRPDDDFALHLTYSRGVGDLEQRLQQFSAARGRRRYHVAIRPDPDLSLSIDLADPLPF